MPTNSPLPPELENAREKEGNDISSKIRRIWDPPPSGGRASPSRGRHTDIWNADLSWSFARAPGSAVLAARRRTAVTAANANVSAPRSARDQGQKSQPPPAARRMMEAQTRAQAQRPPQQPASQLNPQAPSWRPQGTSQPANTGAPANAPRPGHLAAPPAAPVDMDVIMQPPPPPAPQANALALSLGQSGMDARQPFVGQQGPSVQPTNAGVWAANAPGTFAAPPNPHPAFPANMDVEMQPPQGPPPPYAPPQAWGQQMPNGQPPNMYGGPNAPGPFGTQHQGQQYMQQQQPPPPPQSFTTSTAFRQGTFAPPPSAQVPQNPPAWNAPAMNANPTHQGPQWTNAPPPPVNNWSVSAPLAVPYASNPPPAPPAPFIIVAPAPYNSGPPPQASFTFTAPPPARLTFTAPPPAPPTFTTRPPTFTTRPPTFTAPYTSGPPPRALNPPPPRMVPHGSNMFPAAPAPPRMQHLPPRPRPPPVWTHCVPADIPVVPRPLVMDDVQTPAREREREQPEVGESAPEGVGESKPEGVGEVARPQASGYWDSEGWFNTEPAAPAPAAAPVVVAGPPTPPPDTPVRAPAAAASVGAAKPKMLSVTDSLAWVKKAAFTGALPTTQVVEAVSVSEKVDVVVTSKPAEVSIEGLRVKAYERVPGKPQESQCDPKSEENATPKCEVGNAVATAMNKKSVRFSALTEVREFEKSSDDGSSDEQDEDEEMPSPIPNNNLPLPLNNKPETTNEAAATPFAGRLQKVQNLLQRLSLCS
ncbi:hypothetical protein DENSPDRAFT_502798 [Dentipellis sp. KUC8613]|nr:hypothetical protein DENSPDRAFT_502798 [Dentipellis sp. KUC8613]